MKILINFLMGGESRPFRYLIGAPTVEVRSTDSLGTATWLPVNNHAASKDVLAEKALNAIAESLPVAHAQDARDVSEPSYRAGGAVVKLTRHYPGADNTELGADNTELRRPHNMITVDLGRFS